LIKSLFLGGKAGNDGMSSELGLCIGLRDKGKERYWILMEYAAMINRYFGQQD